MRFRIGSKSGVVMIRIQYFSFTYECRYEGQPVPEMTFDIRDHEEKEYSCTIPSVSIRTVNGKKVAVFRVEMTCDGKTETFNKRYRDFATFDAYLRGGFDGHHLLQNLPHLPPKQVYLLTDHFSKPFLSERRKQLEMYVNKLVKVPKVVTNPDFVAFFTKRQRTRSEGKRNNGQLDSKSSNPSGDNSNKKGETDEYEDMYAHASASAPEGEGMVDINFDKD